MMGNKALQSGIYKSLKPVSNGSGSGKIIARTIVSKQADPEQRLRVACATLTRALSFLTKQDRACLSQARTKLSEQFQNGENMDLDAAFTDEILAWTQAEMKKVAPASPRYQMTWTVNAAAANYLKFYRAASKERKENPSPSPVKTGL